MHSAVNDHSRLAYCEVLPDEQGPTAVGLWTRAQAFSASHGVRVERVLTDNGACYRSHVWRDALEAAGQQRQDARGQWLHTYNHHRAHTALGGTPVSRVNNLPGHYS